MRNSRGWLSAAAVALWATAAIAADHGEAPGAAADPHADIADLYAWHTDGDTLVAVLTVSGASDIAAAAAWDADVLYGIHIDTDGDVVTTGAEINVWARVAENSLGEWGLQVTNLPGHDGVIEGPVGTALPVGGTPMAWAGLADDPFFFDQGGFVDTVTNGDIDFEVFDASDDLACTNATAFVFEMDLTDAAFDSATTVQVWATTGRLPAEE